MGRDAGEIRPVASGKETPTETWAVDGSLTLPRSLGIDYAEGGIVNLSSQFDKAIFLL